MLAGVSLDFQDTMEGEVGNRRIIKINKVLKIYECAHPSSQSMCWDLVNPSNVLSFLLMPSATIKQVHSVFHRKYHPQ